MDDSSNDSIDSKSGSSSNNGICNDYKGQFKNWYEAFYKPNVIKKQLKDILQNMTEEAEGGKEEEDHMSTASLITSDSGSSPVVSLDIDNMKMQPPLTEENVKKLIDSAIPKIKKEVETKFWVDHELDVVNLFLDKEGKEKYFEAAEKKRLIKEQNMENEKNWREEVNNLKEDFVRLMQAEMRDIGEKMNKEAIYKILKGKLELENLMTKKVEETIKTTSKRLTKKFASILEKYSSTLHEHFLFYLSNAEVRMVKIKKTESLKSATLLQKLKKSSSKDFGGIMYMFPAGICPCQSSATYAAKLKEAKQILKKTNEKLERVTQDHDDELEEILRIEHKLYFIIKQFQKYIYFVLQALPKHADFLLEIEKLMIFELTKFVMDTKPNYFQDGQLIVNKSDPCLCSRSEVPLNIGIEESHDRRIHTIDSSSFYSHYMAVDSGLMFSKNLNIREDFRNMVKQGLERTEGNELWNFYFEKSEAGYSVLSEKEVRIHNMDNDYRQSDFRKARGTKTDSPTSTVSNILDWPQSSLASTISGYAIAEKNAPTNKSRLIGIRDSLIIHKSRHYLLGSPDTSIPSTQNASSLRVAKDSITMLKSNENLFCKLSSRKSSLTKLGLLTKSKSRLSLTVDSLTMLRKSVDSKMTKSQDTITLGTADPYDKFSAVRSADSIDLFADFLDNLKSRRSSIKPTRMDRVSVDIPVKKLVTISHFEIIKSTSNDVGVIFDETAEVIPNNYSFSSSEEAPKHLNSGLKIVEIAACMAACTFNEGYISILLLMNELEVIVGPNARAFAENHDYKRIEYARRQSLDSSKKARSEKRMEFLTKHESYEEVEGLLYGPGIAD